MNALTPDLLMTIPMSVIFFICMMSVIYMFIGMFKPQEAVWRGMGGAIYIFGCGLYIANYAIDDLTAFIMLSGIALMMAPRGWKYFVSIRTCPLFRRSAANGAANNSGKGEVK